MLSKPQQIVIDTLGCDYTTAGSTEIRIDCPFCGHSNKKLYINDTGVFHCFVCGTSGGNVISFMMKYYNISYSQAKLQLGDSSLEIEQKFVSSTNKVQLADSIIANIVSIKKPEKKKSMIPLPTGARKLLDNYRNEDAIPFYVYLNRRGVSFEQLHRFDIRYVHEGISKTSKGTELKIRNSLIFITTMEGEDRYWNTRSIEREPYIKTFNASGDKDKYYSKQDTIFNYDAINSNSKVVICEGVFNALTVDRTGLSDVAGVATFGKQITNTQLDLIVRKNPRYYYLYLDNDAINIEFDLVSRLVEKGVDISKIKLVPHEYGNRDANDLGYELVRELLLNPTSLTDNYLKQAKINYFLGVEKIKKVGI